MMFAMYTPRATASVFAWALLIPILSHLLLGRRLGLSIAILFMSVTVVLFLYKYHDNPALMQVTPLANLSILSLVILALSHAYEVSRERSEHTLYHMAHTDFLTGVANRTQFSAIFERENSARSARADPCPSY
jgi:predicted signal transduction protein with EAL and GGDEF domain